MKNRIFEIILTIGLAMGVCYCWPKPKQAETVNIPLCTTDEQTQSKEALSFDDLLDAIEWVESKGDPWAVGDGGDAVGAYQIHKIYVDDVNRLAKSRIGYFSYADRSDKKKSRKMTSIYLRHYGGTFEEMARKHNGGPQGHKKESTKAYWLKVKARMESAK